MMNFDIHISHDLNNKSIYIILAIVVSSINNAADHDVNISFDLGYLHV